MLELRSYQRKALDAVAQAEREGVRLPLIVHPTGTGKGHPGHTDILTSEGWRKWADLKPGDRVFGSYGMPTEVTAVYDRGVLPTFRVTFSDGAAVEVDGDHLWTVQDYRYRRTAREWRTLSTAEISAEGLTFGPSRRWAVPLTQILYRISDPFLPIDPYTLGALIANGGLTGSGTSLTTPDADVIARIRAADRHVIRRSSRDEPGECPRYSLPGLSRFLRELGLNVHSREKFIPDDYLLSGPGERLALLQGLMDGDGSSRDDRRTANYHTTSPRLADDVRHLVMSLGGTATISAIDRERDGRPYQDITVYVMPPTGMELFGTGRKKGRPLPRRIFKPRRTIVDIERVEDQEIRCITVAAPDHLYVVGRDFIVTHNTVTFAHLIRERAESGRAVVLVHREELAQQARDKLRMVAPELSTGIVKGELNQVDEDVTIVSVPTAQRDKRLAQLVEAGRRSPFGTIIADEAQHAPSVSWTKVLTGLGAFHPHGPLTVGFTATPQRDGKTLGVWERVVAFMSIREAIHGKWLVPILPPVVVETSMDLDRVRKSGGDYSEGDLGRAMEESGAIAQIADAYVRHAPERKGVAFTPTVKTAYALAAALTARGITAEALDGETDKDERKAILRRLRTGETRCVTNCGVLTEGFDEPSIDLVVIARATVFQGLYIQQVGRGTRTFPGKTDLMILDATGASSRHDLVSSVDLGYDLDETATDGEPGEQMACRVCEVPCDLPEHRCALCHRYLPAGAVQGNETRHRNCRAGAGDKTDVFGNSRLRWLPLPGGAWCLGAGEQEIVLMVPNGDDAWRLAAYRGNKVEILHDELPADWATGIGEDRAKAFTKVAERSARWLSKPVSERQKSKLLVEGLKPEALPRLRNSGEAADLITRIGGRKALKRMGALTT